MMTSKQIPWLAPGELADSSNVANIAYDVITKRLYVMFHNSTVYEYFDVGEQTFEDFKQAESAGKFLNSHIKPFYGYEKVA